MQELIWMDYKIKCGLIPRKMKQNKMKTHSHTESIKWEENEKKIMTLMIMMMKMILSVTSLFWAGRGWGKGWSWMGREREQLVGLFWAGRGRSWKPTWPWPVMAANGSLCHWKYLGYQWGLWIVGCNGDWSTSLFGELMQAHEPQRNFFQFLTLSSRW